MSERDKVYLRGGEELELVKIDYHRNGVSGNPFYVALFKQDGELMVGVQFVGEPMSTAVLSVHQLTEKNIEFANGNSWRGDVYAPHIAKWRGID